MNKLLALTMTLTLTATMSACVINGGDDDDDPPPNDRPDSGTGSDPDSGPSAVIEPASGVWHYSEFTPIVNNCDLAEEFGVSGGFGLVNNGDRTFTVIPSDDSPQFDCTLIDGDDFDCPNRGEVTEDYSSQGFDAVVHVLARASGRFSQADRATGQQQADVSCTGGDCGLAEAVIGAQLPCTFMVDFEVERLQ